MLKREAMAHLFGHKTQNLTRNITSSINIAVLNINPRSGNIFLSVVIYIILIITNTRQVSEKYQTLNLFKFSLNIFHNLLSRTQ